jgi:hypothetical protein
VLWLEWRTSFWCAFSSCLSYFRSRTWEESIVLLNQHMSYKERMIVLGFPSYTVQFQCSQVNNHTVKLPPLFKSIAPRGNLKWWVSLCSCPTICQQELRKALFRTASLCAEIWDVPNMKQEGQPFGYDIWCVVFHSVWHILLNRFL